jgi:predicted RNA binding protein YcfA (HicA-like mRNA interferase family)
MSRLPRLTYRELTTALQQLGCEFRREAKESHEIWWCPAKRLYTTIPRHSGTMDTGTVKKILDGLHVREQIHYFFDSYLSFS